MAHDPPTTSPDGGVRVPVVLPEGTPAWITADLVETTLRVWQRFYPRPLTVGDAITILLNTGRLMAVLSREDPP